MTNFNLTNINMSWSYSDLLDANWSGLPGDIIDSMVPYLPARDVLKLCLYNDTFNRRICQNQNSIVWKLLYQRDISNNVPSDHDASRYLDVMDEILPIAPQDRLFYGAKHGYEEIVKSALRQGTSVRALNNEALYLAARKGHSETVKLLLDRGADIHAEDDEALRWAAENGNTETVKVLLDRGADIHARNDEALRNAADNGHTETVKLLLDRGADIHAWNDNALFIAAYNGHAETVKLLLAHGATITPEIREIAERKRKSTNYRLIEMKPDFLIL